MYFSVLLSVLAVVFLGLSKVTQAAYCSGSPQPGERTNENAIFESDLSFLRSAKNAKLYEAGPDGARFPILHVWGSPYEVGYAQGTILKDEINKFVTATWNYLSTSLIDAFPGDMLSPEMKALIVEKGLDGALDWTRDQTAPFTPQAFVDEMRGLADASGLDYDLVYRLNMFPELTKASCSFFGTWGESVKSPGHAYQLRALDYDVVGPFKDFPQVTVYHPDEGYAYAQVTWPGSVGVLTGFSSQKIAISEIGVYFGDDSFGQGTFPNTPIEKTQGEPWMFVLRDVLQFTNSLETAEARITNSNRTCNLIIGIGDGNIGKSNGCEYSGYVANFYDDTNQLPVNETWHPVIKDTVYNGMDWLCPGYNQVLGEQLAKFHGAIDENVIVHDILPTTQTGNLHIAVYDLTESAMHVSFARPSTAPPSEPLNAFERTFTRLHMADIFKEVAPEV